jgi:transposase-like protein
MGLSRQTFTKEFKEAAVRRLELGAGIAEVARACEVNPNVLHQTLGTSQTEPLPQGSGVAPSAEVFHFGLYRPILP